MHANTEPGPFLSISRPVCPASDTKIPRRGRVTDRDDGGAGNVPAGPFGTSSCRPAGDFWEDALPEGSSLSIYKSSLFSHRLPVNPITSHIPQIWAVSNDSCCRLLCPTIGARLQHEATKICLILPSTCHSHSGNHTLKLRVCWRLICSDSSTCHPMK